MAAPQALHGKEALESGPGPFHCPPHATMKHTLVQHTRRRRRQDSSLHTNSSVSGMLAERAGQHNSPSYSPLVRTFAFLANGEKKRRKGINRRGKKTGDETCSRRVAALLGGGQVHDREQKKRASHIASRTSKKTTIELNSCTSQLDKAGSNK